jgi:hypothetical protein
MMAKIPIPPLFVAIVAVKFPLTKWVLRGNHCGDGGGDGGGEIGFPPQSGYAVERIFVSGGRSAKRPYRRHIFPILILAGNYTERKF